MRSPNRLLLLPFVIVSLYGCAVVKLDAAPSQLACSGDTVRLTWDGVDDRGSVTLSARPAAGGLPLTGASDGSTTTSISADTVFTATQRDTGEGTAFVRVPPAGLTRPVVLNLSPICPPGEGPRWAFSDAGNAVISARAITQAVFNPSFEVRTLHAGISAIIPTGGSTNAFAGTSAASDWVFLNTALTGRVCPREGTTGPTPITGPVIDPASLQPLSITIDAGCP
jgi:hypothetical protein